MLPVDPKAIAPVNTCIIQLPPPPISSGMCLAYYTSVVISALVTHMPTNVGALPNVDDIGGAQLQTNPRQEKVPRCKRELMKFSMTAVKEFENLTLPQSQAMEGDVFTFEDPQFRGTTRRATEFGEIWYDQHTELTSQEFRLQSSADEAFRWTVGAQYWEQEMQLDDKSFNTFTYLETRPWPASILNAPLAMFHGDAKTFQGAICAPRTEGGEFAGCLDRGGSYWTRDSEHKSVYAMIEYDISDSWAVSVEARCAKETKKLVDPMVMER